MLCMLSAQGVLVGACGRPASLVLLLMSAGLVIGGCSGSKAPDATSSLVGQTDAVLAQPASPPTTAVSSIPPTIAALSSPPSAAAAARPTATSQQASTTRPSAPAAGRVLPPNAAPQRDIQPTSVVAVAPVLPPSSVTEPARSPLDLPPLTLAATGAPIGRVLAYAVSPVSIFDQAGRFVRQVPVASLPAVPAGGVPFHAGPKNLALVMLGGQQLLLDRTELNTDTPRVIQQNCMEMLKRGVAPRQPNIGMGHGNCS
jgi:hypothetical protein